MLNTGPLKVAFFQKVLFVFQISKEKYSKKLSWTWNLNFRQIHFTIIGGKFKFQAQDSFLEYFFFGDLEIWKTNHTFWKKPPLILYPLLENSTTRIGIICKSQWTIISSSIYSNTGSIEILPKSHEISIISYTEALVNSDKRRPTSISSFIIFWSRSLIEEHVCLDFPDITSNLLAFFMQ